MRSRPAGPAVAGIDYPEEKTVVDVLAASRSDVLTTWVEQVRADGELVLTVGQDKARRPVRLAAGEQLELTWRGPDELRSLPAELIAVDRGTVACWRVRPAGPAERGQRRAAVRAPVSAPVQLSNDSDHLAGVTIDISEGGMRCLVDPVAPEAADEAPATAAGGADGAKTTLTVGDVVTVHLTLDGGAVDCRAEVVRRHRRPDRRTEVSVRFRSIPEPDEDLIRHNVFACLRDLRTRGVL